MATLNAEKLFAYTMLEDRRIRGFAEAIGAVFNTLSDAIDDLNIYDLENAEVAVLDAFARMKKIRGYEYCTNETQKRDLAQIGILLKRRAGTVWAIQTILETIGYVNVVIWENAVYTPPIANGTFKANGFVQANGALVYDKYFFSVSADNMTGNEAKARNLIYHYKDPKSFLLSVFNN